jgi:hypothetical protein
MSNDAKKDLLEAGTAAALAISISPIAAVVAAAPAMIGAAWQSMQTRRANKWWQCICKADDAGELQLKIETGLRKESEHVIAGVVESARAACSAVDMAAVPIIAELSRRFIAAEDIPRWFYRGSLQFLERLTAVEIGSIRLLLRETESITTERITIIGSRDERPWRAEAVYNPTIDHETINLTPFADSRRLFVWMKRCDLSLESNAWGDADDPNVVVITHQVLGWLRTAFVDLAS